MLIQDQLDLTCGVVIQTAAQKVCFEHWGQTLAMDWTHSTNNLGFHLGSLVATTPSGRGVPVFDFMAINENAETLEAIFDYFKKKNINVLQLSKHCEEKTPLDYDNVHSMNETADSSGADSTEVAMTPTRALLTNRPGESSDTDRKTMKEVTVVRLRREQREKVAILSSREKYNYAVSCFQSVITYLQNIGSAKFYPALSFWEKLVRQGLNADTQHQNELGCETDDFSDTLSIIDPVDLAAMINGVASWQAPNNSDSSGGTDP
ncbi:hypothetical protein PF008_g14519 [Phytophthora fragariae]|uniref:ZSWIM1/3 RNaseH-like domain-containing protein n=1 Tax=Phytophthora fragariae TaxID=53985 RepID=A0A6G0RI63_9STRA|nr:hypothetical protein PF008_g14519 [Phytophthora fragariae]